MVDVLTLQQEANVALQDQIRRAMRHNKNKL